MFTRKRAVLVALATMALIGSGRIAVAQTNADRQRALWSALKRSLTNDDGEEYFNSHVKNCELPALRGVVTSVVLNEGVSKIVLAMSGTDTGEVTVIVHQGNSKVKPKAKIGAEIEFAGVAIEFTKTPFMLTFDVPAERVRVLVGQPLTAN